jgi:5-methylcytosine-specific restriction enzyme subunit McrC
MTWPRVVELSEFKRVLLPKEELTYELGEHIWRHFGKQVLVEFPSPKTAGQWQLTNQGWAGYLPVTPEFGLSLAPKLPINNLFRMLEYAYDIRGLKFFDGLVGLASMQDVFGRLAELLAHRTLDRVRRGLHRAYEPRSGHLSFVRGRIDVPKAIRTPWRVTLPCAYTEHTADISDNRLVGWTLERIARSGICTDKQLHTVRQAHRAMQGVIGVQSFSARDCVGRTYTRLNDDYATLHALCRFFLEHTGPSHTVGDRRMLPFAVDLATLFEQFVAAWLNIHLPKQFKLHVQETVLVAPEGDVSFRIDASIVDNETGLTRCVMDTKYKSGRHVRPDDVAQVVAYAEIKGAPEALLIYPEELATPLSASIGNIRVRTIPFSLAGNLDDSGNSVLETVLSHAPILEQTFAE